MRGDESTGASRNSVPVSIVMPAYREERRLPASLEALPRAWAEAGLPPYELIVVDDGSDDRTPAIVRTAAALDPRVRLLRHDVNHGKGFAVRAGVATAHGEWILVTDADLSTPPAEAARLFRALARGADVAIGSRRMRASCILVRQPLHREVLGIAFAALRRALVLPSFSDTQCGFKAFRAAAARSIFARCREDRFVYDVEMLWIARRLGYRVAEVPVRWADDPRTQVRPVSASLEMAAGLMRLARRRWSGGR